MREVLNPTPVNALITGSSYFAPVVIWNLIRRCNLTCKHRYTTSANRDFPGELTTPEIFNVMADLKAFHVPVSILSGGEPRLHPEYFYYFLNTQKGWDSHVALSSNGTKISEGKHPSYC
jgi:MoaA/NifB/PqqE/SkfB family radical SAM enzyme